MLRRIRRLIRPWATADDGVSLVEVMMSAVVLAIVAAAAAGILIRTLGLSAESRMRSTAANLAEREKEVSLGQGYDALPPGTTNRAMSVDGQAFTITRTISLLPGTSNANSCSAPDGARLAYKKISVGVTWPTMGSAVRPVQSDTILAVPVGQVNGTLGAVSVPVVDRNATGVAGITVTLSPGGTTATTDRDGCAVFSNLTPGSYTASVNTSGYVGTSNSQTVSVSGATVAAGRLAKTSNLMYDRAATMNLRWTPPAGGYGLPVAGHGVLVERTLLGQTAYSPYCTTTLTTGCLNGAGTVTPAFPWAGAGYGLSAGKCAPATGGKVSFSPAPGSTTNVDLPVGGVTATIKRTAAIYLPTATTITLERAADAATCTGGDSLVVAQGVTLVTDQTYKVQVPYGDWTLKVTSTRSNGSAYTDTKTFTVSSSSRTTDAEAKL